MNIFLDDYRIPVDAYSYTKNTIYLTEDWEIVRNYDEFVKLLLTVNEPINMISFDHDLHQEHYAPREHWADYDAWADTQDFKHKTGLDCCEYFLNFMRKKGIVTLPTYFCHSMNDGRKVRILQMLDEYKF